VARLAEGKVLMSFKRLLVLATVALAVSGVGQLFARPQGQSAQVPSLGDLARQQKLQREKAAKKPASEFSNDNLPGRPPAGALTVAGEMSAEGKEKTGETASPEASQTTAEAGAESQPVHDEKYYGESMSKLQARLETHRRQLSVLEQKLSQGSMVYNPDPQKTLEQESTPAFYSDLNKLRDEIATKKQEIADDERAIDELRDQLRREGGPSGWLRSAQTTAEETAPPTAEEPKPEDKQQTREYWQGRFRTARQRIADAEELQRLSEDELSLLQIQQAQELNPDAQSSLEAQVKAKNAELEDRRAQTAKARRVLEDLEKDFKESGAPEDWSKTD